MNEVTASLVIQGGALGILALVLYYGMRAIREVFKELSGAVNRLADAQISSEKSAITRSYQSEARIIEEISRGRAATHEAHVKQ